MGVGCLCLDGFGGVGGGGVLCGGSCCVGEIEESVVELDLVDSVEES